MKSRTKMPPLKLPIQSEPGWVGPFTRNQAEGAIPNGSRIVKVCLERGDTHPPGSKGIVLGSIGPFSPTFQVSTEFPPAKYSYFVAWDSEPRIAVSVIEYKIKLLKE
jgi:hypothetical protein